MDTSSAVGQILQLQQAFRVIGMLMLTSYLFPRSDVVRDLEEFDFIIVGAGAAGSVVASRLSECEQCGVLLIEAGDDPPLESMVPYLFPFLPRTRYDWNITSETENLQQGCKSIAFNLTCGHVLGGGGSLNYMYYVRGVPADYNSWVKATNDDTWSWDGVFPYFKKSERLVSEEILSSYYSVFHGTNGFLGVSRENSPETYKYLDSVGELFDVVYDINGYQTQGYTLPLYTIAEGLRQTTAYTNLGVNRNRPNLFVLKNSLVTEVLLDDYNNAIGVKANYDTKKVVIYAKKEIILSAGSLNTPKLLMLSGIGPKNDLQSFGIPVKSDLPVGLNYQDQYLVFIGFKMDKSQQELPPVNPYKIPYPSFTGYVALDKYKDMPDYQTVNFITPHDSTGVLQLCAFNFAKSDYICNNLYNAAKGRNLLLTILVHLHPRSRGSVKLRSNNPLDTPKVCTGTYSDRNDLETFTDYVEDFVRIVNTSYFKIVNSEIVDLQLDECKGFTFSSRDYWRCYIRNLTTSMLHFVGTCSLGEVVDSRGRVRNVTGLRVADASIMPEVISGNTYAPAIMIGEKVSDMIKTDNQLC